MKLKISSNQLIKVHKKQFYQKYKILYELAIFLVGMDYVVDHVGISTSLNGHISAHFDYVQ